MVIVGLLLAALVCLAIGLVLASSAWLIASLVASAGVAYLLWKMRTSARESAGGTRSGDSAPGAEPIASVATPATTASSTSVATPAHASATTSTPGTATAPHPSVESSAEPPTEAGPPSDAAATATVAPAPADQVWVIDGRPRYHLADCAIIKDQDAEPIPFAQAAEDGFMPCSLCEPSVAHSTHA